ncbi:hypothetical protein [Conexibacter sp. DBS9H8]|uniref:hypothetical protein n=1 Tax=Conexibacter sp. DBS9H8 TaxID=2937801 RepID=UPI00200F8724|nr:hypothetical protein [Conexibacter sp. DBS9H8]
MAILAFGVGQLVLPGIAAQTIRSRLAPHGNVLSARVSVFPAIELLFGAADRVSVVMGHYRADAAQVASDLEQAAGVNVLQVRVHSVTAGLLTLTGVTVTKRGTLVTGSGDISEATLRGAVPFLSSVTPVASAGGQLTLLGTANVPFLGPVSAEATVSAVNGSVVVAGAGLFSIFHLTVFSDPHLEVLSVAGARRPGGLSISVRARYR